MIAVESFLGKEEIEQRRQKSILRTNLIGAFHEVSQNTHIPGDIEKKIDECCDAVLKIMLKE